MNILTVFFAFIWLASGIYFGRQFFLFSFRESKTSLLGSIRLSELLSFFFAVIAMRFLVEILFLLFYGSSSEWSVVAGITGSFFTAIIFTCFLSHRSYALIWQRGGKTEGFDFFLKTWTFGSLSWLVYFPLVFLVSLVYGL